MRMIPDVVEVQEYIENLEGFSHSSSDVIRHFTADMGFICDEDERHAREKLLDMIWIARGRIAKEYGIEWTHCFVNDLVVYRVKSLDAGTEEQLGFC